MDSTLNAAFVDLKAEVGHFLGYGRGLDKFGDREWSRRQLADIERSVQGGLRNFYHCGFDWSFLHPTTSLTLESDANTVDLPDDFGGLEGRIIASLASGTLTCYLSDGPAIDVYKREKASPDATGAPQFLCKEPRSRPNLSQSTKWRLRVYPLADQDYTLTLQYYILPDYLDGSHPYAYGGAAHAETLLTSCLAVAEKIIDNTADVMAMAFKEKLAQSIDIDRRHQPQTLGLNIDRSDEYRSGHGFKDRGRFFEAPVTFDGVQY